MRVVLIIIVGTLLFKTLCAQSPNHIALNGANLFVKTIGTGDYLIILHGGPGLNHQYFRPHLDALAKEYTLVYFDQRGCGQSSLPDADSLTLRFLVQDIEAIRKHFNIEKINLFAHSFGAVLAAKYAKRFPDNVNKLILSNPVPLSREYDAEMMRITKERMTLQDSTERAALFASGSFTPEVYEKIFKIGFYASAYNRSNIEKLKLHLPDNFNEASRSLFTGLSKNLMQYNFYDHLNAFQFPVLVIYGKADGIPFESVLRLNNNLPNSELIVMKKSGHFPFIEEPTLFTKSVLKFLKKR